MALALAAKAPPPPGKFLAVDAHRHRVTITLIASYDDANGGFNFDGYSRYLMWTVPRGWTVRVVCKTGAAAALVRGRPRRELRDAGFRGAEIPHPQIGLEAGHTARFTFRASRKVSTASRVSSGHETARMWDVLKIVRHGRPSVVDLRDPG